VFKKMISSTTKYPGKCRRVYFCMGTIIMGRFVGLAFKRAVKVTLLQQDLDLTVGVRGHQPPRPRDLHTLPGVKFGSVCIPVGE
jgi:hypothetical protein